MNPKSADDVSLTLVRTKVAPPQPMAGFLARPDIVSRLAAAPGRLTLISAPAGWGKTSLLSAWSTAEQESRRFAFLRLEAADDDAPLFWTYVITALRTIHPGLMSGATGLLRNPDVDPLRLVVPRLVNELCEIADPIALVLDDYHLITKPVVHESVLYFVDHLPPSFHLALATRTDPPLPLGRLRASGDLTEVRARELQFSDDEATSLLRNRFGLDLDAGAVQLLRTRTEGWPAGLHLAGLSLQAEDDRPGFIAHFAGDDRNIAEYLTSEVLEQLPPNRRDFLLKTSVLDHLTGDLCDAVAEVDHSDELLEELYHQNLFVLPLDGQREWYRYHQLFADWLRHELHRTNAASIAGLHARASRWHSANNSTGPAISHALAAGDDQRAADLLDRYLTDLPRVQWSSVLQWLADLPREVGADHPMVATAQLMFALGRGDFKSGSQWAKIAGAAVDSAPVELRPMIDRTVALFRALNELAAGDLEDSRAAFLEIANDEHLSGTSLHAMASGYAGTATFWSQGAGEAVPLLTEGAAACERLSLTDGGVTALLAAAYAEIGEMASAEETAAEALLLRRPASQNRFPTLMAAHYAQGKVLLNRGKRTAAIEQIERGLAMAQEWVEPIFTAYGLLALADANDGYVEKRALVRQARGLIDAGGARGRIGDLVAAAERRLAIQRPAQRTAGTVHVEPLTKREQDVLRHLARAVSLREIADELFVSHNTIKGYTKAIYRKLGVSSREDAVDTARQLDLI